MWVNPYLDSDCFSGCIGERELTDEMKNLSLKEDEKILRNFRLAQNRDIEEEFHFG